MSCKACDHPHVKTLSDMTIRTETNMKSTQSGT